MSRDPEYYRRNWDAYYTAVRGGTRVPWDVPHEDAAALDLITFGPWFDPALPVLDLGCGTGTQSVFLRTRFRRVIGADISSEVVRMAHERHATEGLTFEVLNALSPEEISKFHARHGDVNVYMRGTLQQIRPEDRSAFVDGLRTALGPGGTLYFLEVSPLARRHFVEMHLERGGLPPALERVLAEGVTALTGVAIEEVPTVFWGMRIVVSGPGTISLSLGNGESTQVPATYGVVRNPQG
jgi:SAM-dependent methyltransferase